LKTAGDDRRGDDGSVDRAELRRRSRRLFGLRARPIVR
jgi:hypothetical protein